MTGTEVVVPVGQGTLALLQWEGHRLRPVNMRHFCGQFSFLPADWRGFSPGGSPAAEAARVVGRVLADEGAPANRRQAALLALCGVAAANPALVAASASANLKIRFGAMACRIAQGDIGLLGRLARKFAVEAPPPEAADLTYAILGIRDPDAVPALSAMAQAKLAPLRTAAIEALGDTHSLAALPALRYALVHGDFVTRYAAARALPYILGGKAEVLTQDNFRAQEATIIKNWLARIAAAGVHGN